MALKSLNFTTLPASSRNSADARRAKIIARLEEQKRLLADSSYVRISKRWVKIDGQRSQIEKQQRVFPWWRPGPNGSLVFFVRLGGKPIEFDKGKSGIAVQSADKLEGVIDTVIAAVRSGELDAALEQAVKAKAAPKKRAA